MSRFLVPLLAAGGGLTSEVAPLQEPVTLGRIEDRDIREASGLARSRRGGDVLWVINDKGAEPRVHALDSRGARLGEFDLAGARNEDWEDLASFALDGTPYLLVADVGDNDAVRESRTLYVVEEPPVPEAPEEEAGVARVAWRVDFVYPDGPRDAESVAVDVAGGRALVLSKRDWPPVLYAVPLRPEGGGVVTATRLGEVTSLPPAPPQGPAPDVKHWRPVGMDVSDDGLAAVVLTYSAVYYYERRPDQDWLAALNSTPRRVGVGALEKAEAVAFGDARRGVVVTGEGKHAPLLAIDFGGAPDD